MDTHRWKKRLFGQSVLLGHCFESNFESVAQLFDLLRLKLVLRVFFKVIVSVSMSSFLSSFLHIPVLPLLSSHTESLWLILLNNTSNSPGVIVPIYIYLSSRRANQWVSRKRDEGEFLKIITIIIKTIIIMALDSRRFLRISLRVCLEAAPEEQLDRGTRALFCLSIISASIQTQKFLVFYISLFFIFKRSLSFLSRLKQTSQYALQKLYQAPGRHKEAPLLFLLFSSSSFLSSSIPLIFFTPSKEETKNKQKKSSPRCITVASSPERSIDF